MRASHIAIGVGIGLGLTAVALAQSYSPGNLGVTRGGNPQNVAVLDSAGYWALMGTVDPSAHVFTPVGGGGGGGGAVTAIPGAFQDGWSVTGGSTTDPSCGSPTSACSAIALAKATLTAVQSGTGLLGSTFPSPTVGVAGDASGNVAPLYEADGQSPINVAAAGTTTLVASAAGKRIFVTGFEITGTGSSTSAYFEYGTQTTTPCDTGAQRLTGPYPPGVAIARGGLGVVWTIPTGNALCIVVAGSTPQYSGSVSYTAAP